MTKIISRAWLGPAPMPSTYFDYGNDWLAFNEGWTLVDWDYAAILDKNWINKSVITDILNRMNNGSGILTVEAAVQIADVIGYELIYEFGGVYTNCDVMPVRSLAYMFEHFALGDSAYAGKEDNTTDRIVNAVLGGPTNHPFWEYVIEVLPTRYFSNPLTEMVYSTGPQLLTECAQSWHGLMKTEGTSELSLKVLPTEAFNPLHWENIPLGTYPDLTKIEYGPNTVGIHGWAHRKDQRTNLVR